MDTQLIGRSVRQRKTGRPVRFELTEPTREAIDDYLKKTGRRPGEFLFPGRGQNNRCMTTRQYARLVGQWIAAIGLDPSFFGTHSLRCTKATLIYRRIAQCNYFSAISRLRALFDISGLKSVTRLP